MITNHNWRVYRMTNIPFTMEETTVTEIHEAFRKNGLTSVKLVDFYLNRIEDYDKEVRAVVAINPKARKEAAELDTYYKETGEMKGPLHGIPVLVKDQAETAGIPTSFGSEAFKHYIPEVDATVVEKLRNAGAVILAKTNLCDFAAGWFSFSSVNGQTRNAYDPNRDAGGSSAGTGAGVALNFGTIGIGEDTGGSARIPASFNNLFGLRPTIGLISRFGFSPLVHFQDTPGPITRTVRDMAKLMDVLVGYDPKDEFTTAATLTKDIGQYEALLEESTLKGKRIGILRQAFGSNEDMDSYPVNQVVEAAIAKLKDAGVECIDDVTIPNLEQYLEETSLYTLQSKKDITNFLSNRAGTPLKSLDEVYDHKAFHPLNDLFHDIVKAPDDPTEAESYYRQRWAQEEFKQEVINVMAMHQLDAILYPDVKILPPTYQDLEDEKWTCLTFPTNTVIASQTKLPAISIPGGFTPQGIPVGFELMSKPFSEVELLQIAYGYEQIAQPRREPSTLKGDLESV